VANVYLSRYHQRPVGRVRRYVFTFPAWAVGRPFVADAMPHQVRRLVDIHVQGRAVILATPTRQRTRNAWRVLSHAW
jgi:hypothetical protein